MEESSTKWPTASNTAVLGFRPPHRIFLTNFFISEYNDVPRGLFLAILHHHNYGFKSVRNFCVSSDYEVDSSLNSSLVSEGIRNFFRDA